MIKCINCGWTNPKGLVYCEKCHEQLSYDVFISYSRKDYVDDMGNILPNNILSTINKTFEAYGISYWFDEDGIYSGDEFASVLTRAIRNSKVFLFISSVNSNQSKWTSNEISTALEFKKAIIPFRMDDSPYNDSVMMKIISFDYIECKDEEKAINKLVRAVKHHIPSKNNLNRKSIINVPNGAQDATVIFDVDGKRTERVFKYNNGKAKIVNEQIIDINQNQDRHTIANKSSDIESVSSKIKKEYHWFIFIVLLFVILGGGLITFCKRGEESNKPQQKAIYKENISEECKPVDLGLSSGILWADRNIGAKTISDFGDLFAWGETSKKKDYSQGMYDTNNKPTSNLSSKKYDVATALLGEKWVIPTEKQYRELLDECQWQWTQIGNHTGYKITGKNGRYIFLPAAGWICSSKPDYQNRYGYYWTSNRVVSNPQFARSLLFPKEGKGIVGNGYLYVGRSIRAVYIHNTAINQ